MFLSTGRYDLEGVLVGGDEGKEGYILLPLPFLLQKRKNSVIDGITFDSSWVVPYSPDLMRRFRTHIYVKLFISIVGSIKYLFKYVCKGSDRVIMEMVGAPKCNCEGNTSEKVPTIDKIHGYRDARCISAFEAAWGCFLRFEHEPTVERLEVHLGGHHIVYFQEGEHEKPKAAGSQKSTELLAWFSEDQKFPNARHIRYIGFPKYFRWDKGLKAWKPRAKFEVLGASPKQYDFTRAPEKVLRRIYNISPREGEKYFFRMLLLHKTGAVSYSDQRTCCGVQYATFRETCFALGLIPGDQEWFRCMQDAFLSNFVPLTEVFSIVIDFSDPKIFETCGTRPKNDDHGFRERNSRLCHK